MVQLGVHAGLSSRRPRVQIPSGPPVVFHSGRVAQLVEHTPEKRGVTGSKPVPTTQPLASEGFSLPNSHYIWRVTPSLRAASATRLAT